MAQVSLKVMQLVLAILALALTFVSASPIKRDSEHSSHELDSGSTSHAQLPDLGHVFRDVVARVTSPPPPPPPPVLDNCGVIYIARDGRITKTAPPSCPTNPALGARETRAVGNVPEIDPDGDGGFYIARANVAELSFQARGTEPAYVGPLPLVPTPAPVLSYVDKQVNNLPRQTSSPPPISSRPPIYIARHDIVRQQHFPTNVPEPAIVNIDPRQTASPGGPVQGGNGGVIYIARVKEDEDDAPKPPEQTGGDGTIYIAREEHVSAPPQETGGDGGIWIARRQINAPPPPGGDMTGCIIYIARDGKGTSKTPPPGCPTLNPERVRDLPHLPQETKSYNFRVEDHVAATMREPMENFENQMEKFPTTAEEMTDVMKRMAQNADEMTLRHTNAERDILHKPPFSTLFSPGLTTLTVSAATRETGGVVVITGPQSETNHKTHPSKTKSTVLPGTFTITGGSGTFTVITTNPVNSEPTHVLGRIPPPEWLSTHTTAKSHVRPTDKPVGWRSSTTAKATTHIQSLDKHTFTWKHKTQTSVEAPTHVRPTDKATTWGLEARANVPASTPTLKPAPSPSCTLTVKPPTVTMMASVKTVHPSTTTVTQYHSCGGCLLEAPQTLDRRWEATKTVAGVETVTVDKCGDSRRRPTHGPVTMRTI